jgi:hypothetical protein
METNGKFYLGRLYDQKNGLTTEQPLLYDPADLVTHAVVVGMTGSGKTGLCINLLEEAALNGIPAIMVDPKGDITNSLLHFPDLAAKDFQPWVNADQARREGLTLEEAAVRAADAWRSGLADWGIGTERLQALKNAAGFSVYTPGSSSGVPVSILASFKAPEIDWNANRELLREKISGTVTALLALVGMEDIDPVRSQEHILLANIFEHAWSQGNDMDLGELILQTQNPPFEQLGVFDVNTFFPEKERFGLATQLNNILASPAFQSWVEGDALDIQAMMYLPDGRPRHNVFYIAHLNDAERMFFVTLLYSAVEAWMRAQSGTSQLRSIVYFDEIFGFMPPIGNPPSKQPMLRMLKQARAFGVGQVLVTQNPVDVDYKALSNAGTWFIGKLQTEQDKARLLDGLAGATPGILDRAEYDQLISALGKRVFLLHNVHTRQPVLFQTRWAMNYLAGPITRVQIPQLNQMAGRTPLPTRAAPPRTVGQQTGSAARPSLDSFQAIPILADAESDTNIATVSGSATRPALPSGVGELFLPNNLTFSQAFKAAGKDYPPEAFAQGLLYRPVILAQAQIRFLDRRYGVDFEMVRTALVEDPDRRGVTRWEDYLVEAVDGRLLDRGPIPRARFAALEAPFSEVRLVNSLQKDFLDWAYRNARITVRANSALGVYAGPDVSQAEFRRMCAERARERRDAEITKAGEALDRKINTLETRLNREVRELDSDESELSQRRMEEMGTHAENFFSLFSKRSRRISTSLTKRRLTEQARAEVDESRKAIDELTRQIKALELEKAQVLDEIGERWGNAALESTEISLAPYKKDVLLDLFGVAWMPYHLIQVGAELLELPGFAAGSGFN